MGRGRSRIIISEMADLQMIMLKEVDGERAGAGFYDADDPLIRLARAPRETLTSGTPDFERALASADEQSAYARVLAEGVEDVRAVDAFVDRRDDGEALATRLP